MLKGIDPLLTPDLLKVLAEMGHGDEIVITDANFTAASLARGKPLITLAGVSARQACQAVLSVLPLDTHVAQPVAFMKVCHTADGYLSGLQREITGQWAAAGWVALAQCEAMERFAFYERVKQAYAGVHTGELQPYANFLFKKGVLGEALRA